MIRSERVISENAQKSPRCLAISTTPRRKKSPAKWRSLILRRIRIRRYQRPKNSHNRMITGIGTPNSQSRIPRPMFASLRSSDGFKNVERDGKFQQPERKTRSGVTADEKSAEGWLARTFASFHQFGIAAVFSGHLQEPLAQFRISDLAGQTFGLLGLEFVMLALAHGVPQNLRRV
jgi:hypothetical protein